LDACGPPADAGPSGISTSGGLDDQEEIPADSFSAPAEEMDTLCGLADSLIGMVTVKTPLS
jgi:hypothetical protein